MKRRQPSRTTDTIVRARRPRASARRSGIARRRARVARVARTVERRVDGRRRMTKDEGRRQTTAALFDAHVLARAAADRAFELARARGRASGHRGSLRGDAI